MLIETDNLIIRRYKDEDEKAVCICNIKYRTGKIVKIRFVFI